MSMEPSGPGGKEKGKEKGNSLRLTFNWIGRLAYLYSMSLELGGPLTAIKNEKEIMRQLLDDEAITEGMNEKEILKTRQSSGEYMGGLIHGSISLALYLCVRNADLPRLRPERPEATRTRKGLRYFPPAETAVWDVGMRIGPALRQAQLQNVGVEAGDSGKRPRAHVRRAHWHHYWTGPKNGERELILKWVSPTLVNMQSADDLPSVIRLVG